MSEFLLQWSALWLEILGVQGSFPVFFGETLVWSLDYVDLSGKLLCIFVFIWLLTLTIRLLRKLFCGVVK